MSSRNHRSYRFFPLFVASFLRTFFVAIFGLALPNNYVFGEGISAGFVGLISSIPAITYVGGPFLGRFLTNKTKSSKKTILISACFSVSMMALVVIFVQYTQLVFVILIILFRSLEGLSNGMYWPEIFNYITTWEKMPNQKEKKMDFLKIFNYSWNFGLIFGFLAGYLLVEWIGNDYFALIISLSIAGISIINLIFLEPREEFHVHEDRAVVMQNFKISPQNRDEYENPEKAPYSSESQDISLHRVPLIMGLGGIFIFASTKSILRFTLPYYFEDIFLIDESQWIYLIVLAQQFLQNIGLQLIPRFEKKRYSFWISMSIVFSSMLILLFPPNIAVILTINIITGFFFGMIHGVAQRIILDKGKHYNSKKYTMLSEVVIGLAFGIPPIAGGFLYEINLIYVIVYQVCVSMIMLLFLLYFHFKYMKSEELGILKKNT